MKTSALIYKIICLKDSERSDRDVAVMVILLT